MQNAISRMSMIVAVVLSFESAVAAPLNEPDSLPVICPAIRYEGWWRPSSKATETDGLSLPLEAVVVGRVRITKPNPTTKEEPHAELIVEKTECGFCKLRRIPLAFDVGWPEGSALYELRATLDPKRPCVRLATTDLRQTNWHRALWSARFDYRVLSSRYIFVGKLTRILDGVRLGMVEVVRPLGKRGPRKGAVLPCSFRDFQASTEGRPKLVDDCPRLVFVESTFHVWRGIEPDDESVPKGPYHKVTFLQPVQMEREVLSAVGRGPLYPKRERRIGVTPLDSLTEKPIPSRAIIYRGPIEHALDMLESTDFRIQTLGNQTLRERPRESKPRITASIRKKALDFNVGPDRHRVLHDLVDILASIEMADRGFPSIRKLLDGQLNVLEWNGSTVPVGNSPGDYDSNRTFEWLIHALPDDVLYRHYSTRLSLSSTRTAGNSPHRIRAVANEHGFDDQREIAEALLRPGTKRLAVHHSPWTESPTCRGAFSPDGEFYARATSVYEVPGGTIRIRRVSDWSEVETIWTRGPVYGLLFSPDGRWLYVDCGIGARSLSPQSRSQRVHRIDWKTGRVDREYTFWRTGTGRMHLSADGNRLASCVDSERVLPEFPGSRSWSSAKLPCEIRVFETQTGKQLAAIPTDPEQQNYRVHPSGTWLAHRVNLTPKNRRWGKKPEPDHWVWKYHSLGAKPPKLPAFERKDTLVFVGQRYLLTTEPIEADKDAPASHGSTLFCLHDSTKNGRILASLELPFSSCVVESVRGRVTISATRSSGDDPNAPTNELVVLDVPSLKVAHRCGLPKVRNIENYKPVFSPKDDIVLLDSEYSDRGPFVVGLESKQTRYLDENHRSRIESIEFTDSGELLTLSNSGRLCWWEAKSLQPKKRLGSPENWEPLGCRPPRADLFAGLELNPEGISRLHLLDTRTGKTVSQYGFRWNREGIPTVVWRNERELLLLDDSATKDSDRLTRLDIRTGKKLGEIEFDGFRFWYTHQVEGRRIRFLHFDWDSKEPACSSKTIDIRTGQASPTRTIPWLVKGNGGGGLVPGKSWGWMGLDPMRLVDWATGKQLTQRRFPNCAIFDIEFSPDGSRYALSCRMPLHDDRVSSWLTPSVPEPVVRIHETRTGKLLVAFRPSHEARLMRFDPSGTHLALVTMSQSLEVWRLSP